MKELWSIESTEPLKSILSVNFVWSEVEHEVEEASNAEETSPSPWSVVVVGLNRKDVQHAEDEALAVAETVRKYGLCRNPIVCVGRKAASKTQIREALWKAASSSASKLLFFFAGHGQSDQGDMTLLEPADAPETADDQDDDVSSWVALEDEVWCAVNGRGFQHLTVVTIYAICRAQAYPANLPADPVDPFPSQDKSITFCDVYLCKHDEMLNDVQYFASAFEFYMSLGIPDLHSLLYRIRADLFYLTVGKVSLQIVGVEKLVWLETRGSFKDPEPKLEEGRELEALQRPIFLSRYLDKLASQEMETSFQDTRATMAAIARQLMRLPHDTGHLRTEEELECIRATSYLGDVFRWLRGRESPQGRDVTVGDVPPKCLLDTIAESLLEVVPDSSNDELIGFVQHFIEVMREFTRRYRLADLQTCERANSESAGSGSSAAGSTGAVAACVGVTAGLSGGGVGSVPLVSTNARRHAAESADTRPRRSVRYVFRVPRVENVSEADKQELSEYICCVLKQLNIPVQQVCFMRGSLLILLVTPCPVDRTQLHSFQGKLEEWTWRRMELHAPHWRRAGRPYYMDFTDLPGNQKQLAFEMLPFFQTAALPIAWMRAEDVRKFAADRLGIKPSAVSVFEDEVQRGVGQWLHGTGRVHVVVARSDWHDLLNREPAQSRELLMQQTHRSWGQGSFGDDLEFQAGAVILCGWLAKTNPSVPDRMSRLGGVCRARTPRQFLGEVCILEARTMQRARRFSERLLSTR
ncbi:unnamed protein product [Symbiodinium sp. CCMP2456]|nr:unnamed protein product [Symbiodinium sp. CCMP2456]